MTGEEKRNEKEKRILDALSLKEPDRVPLCPALQTFPYTQNGFTVAQCVYDMDKTEEAVVKYLETYDPDAANGYANAFVGMGPILEKAAPKNFRWAGSPERSIDDNSVQQFIEFALLRDDEYEMFNSDRTGWLLSRCFPRVSGVTECLKDFQVSTDNASNPYLALAAFFGRPEAKRMIQTLWEIDEIQKERAARIAAIDERIVAMGYPILVRGQAAVPFDSYSDFLRGTIEGMEDLYDRPEEVERFCEEKIVRVLDNLRALGEKYAGQNKYVFMALHKGFDSFMNTEHYQKYYWSYLQKIICAIIDNGMIPYIFCEGSYNSRLSFLKEVPKGKVLYRFEKIDIEAAKRELGDTACISGGFRSALLNYGTREAVIDEVKRFIDICAPGGGYIFDLDCGLSSAKPENVEAMMDTVKTYGKR